MSKASERAAAERDQLLERLAVFNGEIARLGAEPLITLEAASYVDDLAQLRRDVTDSAARWDRVRRIVGET